MTEATYNKFVIGSRVSVHLDWDSEKELRNRRAQIIKVQQNGNETFYRVFFIGKNSLDLEKKFGTLFTEKEIKLL
jgi:hypothetical protein